MIRTINCTINNKDTILVVDVRKSLLEVLREQGLTSVKQGCGVGECGACTVLMDNEPVMSCMILTVACDGKSVTTIEGLADTGHEKIYSVQEAFIENFGFQCGFCTPGIIMSSKALLDSNPLPSEQEIKEALSGNLCRCANYPNIIRSVQAAAKKMEEV